MELDLIICPIWNLGSLMNDAWCMLDGSWLMAQGSWLMAKGGQGRLMAPGQGPARPRGPKGRRARARTWGLPLGPWGRAGPWPWAMSLPWPPLAMSPEPWAMNHQACIKHQASIINNQNLGPSGGNLDSDRKMNKGQMRLPHVHRCSTFSTSVVC